MAISLPVEGLKQLYINAGESDTVELSTLCNKYWGKGFDINPRTNEDLAYSEALRFMTPAILLDIIDEIRGERDATDS